MNRLKATNSVVMRRFALAASLWMVLGGLGCRPQQSSTGSDIQSVAQVGDAMISAESFASSMQQRAGHNPGRFATLEEKQALLADLIDQEAVYEKARQCGFDQTPEIQQSIRRLVVSRFLELEQRKQAAESAVSDAEVAQYYSEHQDKYRVPERVRGAIIFRRKPAGASAEKCAELSARLQDILHQASSAANPTAFARIVETYSEDQATRYRGGELNWISAEGEPQGIDPSVARALSTLTQPGEFAPLVTTDAGYYIVKLLERQGGSVRPLAQVSEEIRFRLLRAQQEQKRHELYASLRAGLTIRTNLALMASIPPPSPAFPPTPLAVPDPVTRLTQ